MASTALLRTARAQLRLHAFSAPLLLHTRIDSGSRAQRGSSRPQCAARRPRGASSRRARSPRVQASSPATLASEIKGKAASGAPRKAIELLQSAHDGESEWGLPDAGAYRAAARAFIRAERSDLALQVFRMRERALHAPAADPALSAGVLRACLRGAAAPDARRDARRDLAAGVAETLEALLRDSRALARGDTAVRCGADEAGTARGGVAVAGRVDDAPAPAPYALALCAVQGALLRSGAPDEATRAMRALLALGKFGERAAVKTSDYNELVRQYGKARRLEGVFATLDAMRSASVGPSPETFEFLANAAVRSVQFVTGAVSIQTLPTALRAEVAFCGRSNVGKSSLVNMLVNRRALARVSGTPGKTQQFNYFKVNECDGDGAYYLVDLPGVGYARVPRAIRESWAGFMRAYFVTRGSLRVVFHLIDSRHGALADDIELMKLVARGGYGGDYVVVLTKMDKMDKQKVKSGVMRNVKAALAECGCREDTPIVITSAATKLGRDELWRYLRHALKGCMPSALIAAK